MIRTSAKKSNNNNTDEPERKQHANFIHLHAQLHNLFTLDYTQPLAAIQFIATLVMQLLFAFARALSIHLQNDGL